MVLGPHRAYPTLTVQADGTLTGHHGPQRPEGQPERPDPVGGWDGARLFHLAAAELTGILQVLASAVPDTPDTHRAGPSAGPVPVARTRGSQTANADSGGLAAGGPGEDQGRGGTHDVEPEEPARPDLPTGRTESGTGGGVEQDQIPSAATAPAHQETGGTTAAPGAVTDGARTAVGHNATSEAMPVGTRPRRRRPRRQRIRPPRPMRHGVECGRRDITWTPY